MMFKMTNMRQYFEAIFYMALGVVLFCCFKQVLSPITMEDGATIYYNREVPMVWIGGVMKSGISLTQAMLQAHTGLQCVEEYYVIPGLLSMYRKQHRSEIETERVLKAGITDAVLQESMAAYVLSLFTNQWRPNKQLCVTSPFALRFMDIIKTILPNSKFILILRDGRSTCHAAISQNFNMPGQTNFFSPRFDYKTYPGCIKSWNEATNVTHALCKKMGPDSCLPVKYENLVDDSRKEMERVKEFLGISLNSLEWNDDHKEIHRKTSNKVLNKLIDVDHSMDKHIQNMTRIAPMLLELGYDLNEWHVKH